jgi:hypothetical protein
MPALRILNAQGDTCVSWDETLYAAGDAEQVAAVMEAERLFAAARAAGGAAFRVRPGVPAERVTRLEPTIPDDVLIIPPMTGG